MKYKYINKQGEILETNNCLKQFGYDWTAINQSCKKVGFSKEAYNFFKKHEIYNSVFNIYTYEVLGIVFLNDTKFKKLKGGGKN